MPEVTIFRAAALFVILAVFCTLTTASHVPSTVPKSTNHNVKPKNTATKKTNSHGYGRKLLAAEQAQAPAHHTQPTKENVAAKSVQKVEKAEQYGMNQGYGYAGQPYQNTPHYEYHPEEVVQHGDHVHVVPAHFDLDNGDHDEHEDEHEHEHEQHNSYPTNGYPMSGYPNNGYPNSGYPNNGYNPNAAVGASVGNLVGGIIGAALGRH